MLVQLVKMIIILVLCKRMSLADDNEPWLWCWRSAGWVCRWYLDERCRHSLLYSPVGHPPPSVSCFPQLPAKIPRPPPHLDGGRKHHETAWTGHRTAWEERKGRYKMARNCFIMQIQFVCVWLRVHYSLHCVECVYLLCSHQVSHTL